MTAKQAVVRAVGWRPYIQIFDKSELHIATSPLFIPQLPPIVHLPTSLHLLRMAETPRRIGTRTTNANIHPGNLVNATTRKRRTKAQIVADNAAKAAREAKKEKVAEDNLKRIAGLEKSIAEEDANELTPRLRRPRPRRLGAAPSQPTDDVGIPLYADKSDQGMDNNDLSDTTADEYKPNSKTDATSIRESQGLGDDTEDSVIGDQPPKKKQKKPAVRDRINKINDQTASGGGDRESAGGKHAADKGSNSSGPASKASTCVVIVSHRL